MGARQPPHPGGHPPDPLRPGHPAGGQTGLGHEHLDDPVDDGVLNLRTGHPATPDALFLPGSIGKVYTATVVMGLADEGKLDIDAPIRTYLPDFKTADESSSNVVATRHLLTHTSGFDGDHFED